MTLFTLRRWTNRRILVTASVVAGLATLPSCMQRSRAGQKIVIGKPTNGAELSRNGADGAAAPGAGTPSAGAPGAGAPSATTTDGVAPGTTRIDGTAPPVTGATTPGTDAGAAKTDAPSLGDGVDIDLKSWKGQADEGATNKLWAIKTLRSVADASSSSTTPSTGSTGGTGSGSGSGTSAGGGTASNPSAGRVEGNKVIFEIPAGNGRSKSWNEASAPVQLKVGQTLVLVNKDNVSHCLHTNGQPFGHGTPIAPGGQAEYRAETSFAAETGELYEHDQGGGSAYINTKFYIRVTR